MLEYQTFSLSKQDTVILKSYFTNHISKSFVSQTDERFSNFENSLNLLIKQFIFILVQSKSISMLSASSLITKIIKSREILAEEIIFDMIESKDNNDEESSDNIENLNLVITTVIAAIVNVAVNVIIQNLSIKS